MSPRQRRIVGSFVFAAMVLFWVNGDQVRRVREWPDVVMVLILLLVLAIIGYRVWPAAEIVWNRWRTPDGRRALQPTPARVIGGASFAALLILANFAFVRSLGSNITVDAPRMLGTFVILSACGYLVWPALKRSWRSFRLR